MKISWNSQELVENDMPFLKLVSFYLFIIKKMKHFENLKESVSFHNCQENFGVEYYIFWSVFLQKVRLISSYQYQQSNESAHFISPSEPVNWFIFSYLQITWCVYLLVSVVKTYSKWSVSMVHFSWVLSMHMWAVPQLRWLVTSFSLWQVFSQYFSFPCQFSFYQLLHVH
jgi:hypothetical protein